MKNFKSSLSIYSIICIYVKNMDEIKTFCEQFSSFLCHSRITVKCLQRKKRYRDEGFIKRLVPWVPVCVFDVSYRQCHMIVLERHDKAYVFLIRTYDTVSIANEKHIRHPWDQPLDEVIVRYQSLDKGTIWYSRIANCIVDTCYNLIYCVK